MTELFNHDDHCLCIFCRQSQPNNTTDTEPEQTFHEALTALVHNYGTWLKLGWSKEKALETQVAHIEELAAQEANKARLDVIDRITKELEAEQSVEVNEDDSGLNYYYTVKSVEWAIERIKNQVTAEKEEG